MSKTYRDSAYAPSALSLAQFRPDVLTVALGAGVRVIKVSASSVICDISVRDTVVSIGWSDSDRAVLCLARGPGQFYVFNAETGAETGGASWRAPQTRGSGSGRRTARGHPHWSGNGRHAARVRWAGRVVVVELDPNGPANCLVAWARGAWAISEKACAEPVNGVTGLTMAFGAAAWSSHVPGQFFTRDAMCEALTVWAAAAAEPTTRIALREPGETALLALPRNGLFVGFSDGVVGICDVETERHVFLRGPVQAHGVTGLRFLPTGQGVFVTAEAGSSLYSWDSSLMREAEGRRSPRTDAVLSMYVSSLGVIACGDDSGTLDVVAGRSRPLTQQVITIVSFSRWITRT